MRCRLEGRPTRSRLHQSSVSNSSGPSSSFGATSHLRSRFVDWFWSHTIPFLTGAATSIALATFLKWKAKTRAVVVVVILSVLGLVAVSQWGLTHLHDARLKDQYAHGPVG